MISGICHSDGRFFVRDSSALNFHQNLFLLENLDVLTLFSCMDLQMMLFYILNVIQDRYFHSFSDTTDVMLQGKDRYPYPVGFHAVRCYNGETYQMEIHEGTRGPLFVVRNCIRQLELDLLIRIKFNLSYLCISSILFTFEYLLSL